MVKYWLFSKDSSSVRASTLPDWSKTAVGMCLTSVLMAQPKMKSMATGTNSASVTASGSRRRWMNSLPIMPSSLDPKLMLPSLSPLPSGERQGEGPLLHPPELLAQQSFSLLVLEEDE